MTMNEGKALVLGTVLKYDRPFKAAIIGTSTGLSRQLVRYHLMQLVETGGLIKEGSLYIVVDKEPIINSLIDASSRAEHTKTTNTLFINHADQVNQILEWVVALRTLEAPKSHEFQVNTLNELERTALVFKSAKKWVSNTVMAKSTAKKMVQLRSDELKKTYKILNGTEDGFSEWNMEVMERGNE